MKRSHVSSFYLGLICLLASWRAASPALAQVNSTWLGDGVGNFMNGNWSDTARWNPSTVPNNSGSTTYNVTIPYYPGVAQFNGPELDQNITVQNLTLINRVFITNQAPADIGTTLTVNGSTSITTSPGHDGESAALFTTGAWLLGTLTNYNAGTHTLSDAFLLAFDGGTVGWRGADVITNDGTLYVYGSGRMIDQNNNLNAFRNLAVNNGGLSVADGYNFTTAGNLTNNGGISVTTGNGLTTVMTISGALTNFDPVTHTLTNGSYDVEVMNVPGTATLRFPNADIRTLTNATLKLVGAGATMTDLSGLSALRNLAGIQNGGLTSAGTLTITPSGGTFTSDNATHTIDNGANLTIEGNHRAMNNAATNVGSIKGGSQAPPNTSFSTTLTISGNSVIQGGGLDFGGQPGVNTQYHTTLRVMNGIEFRGAYLTGTGTTFADVGLIQGSVLNPGHSPGQLTFQGKLMLDATTTTKVELGGLSAGDQFDQIVQTQGTVTLGGKLLVSFVDGFENKVSNDDTFDILTSGAPLAGSFSNIQSGKRMATSDGKGTFIVTYAGTNKVTLSQFLPPPTVVSVQKTGAQHFKILCHGYPEAGVYRLEASPDLNPDNFVGIVSIGTSDGTTLEFEDLDAGNSPRQFYRVVFPGDDLPLARLTSSAGGASPRKTPSSR